METSINMSSCLNDIKDLLHYSKEKYSIRSCLGMRRDNLYKFKSYKQVIEEIQVLRSFFTKNFYNQYNIYSQYKHNGEEYFLIGIYTKPCKEALKIMLSIHTIENLECIESSGIKNRTFNNITISPIFDTIKVKELKQILLESQIKTLIVDISCLKNLIKNWELLLEENFDKNHSDNINSNSNSKLKLNLKNLILIDEENLADNLDIQDELEFLQEKKIKLIKYSDMLHHEPYFLTNTNSIPCNTNPSNNICQDINNKKHSKQKIILLIYTAGGKGVLISEQALMSTFKCLQSNFNSNYYLNITNSHSNIYYSFTSLAEIQEYINNLLILYRGESIGYYSGDYSKIFDDVQILKPTIIYSYPRVFFKIYEALNSIITKLDESKRNMILHAIKTKVRKVNKEKSLSHHIWDKLVFDKIKNSLGGKINLLIVNGHLLPYVREFMKVCLSTEIIEIYGMAETCGFFALSDNNCQNHHETDFIGKILEINSYEIKENENVGFYIHNSGNFVKSYGELCVTGNNLFSGYINREKYSINIEENCFKTGDYVNLFEKNKIFNLKFIDRIENFIQTSAGYIISANLLEEIYSTSEYISEISIIYESNLIAVVILNKNLITKNCEEKKPRKGSFNSNVIYRAAKEKRMRSASTLEKTDSCNALSPTSSTSDSDEGNCLKHEDKRIYFNEVENLKENILKSFHDIWIKNKLKDHEIIDEVFIVDRNLVPTVENGMLTIKMKLFREKIKEIYKK